MAKQFAEEDLPTQIQQMLDRKELLLASIRQIDQTIAKVIEALGASPSPVTGSGREAEPVAARPSAKRGGRSRSKFGVSTSDVILAFVKAKGHPATQAIMQHLAAAGRTTGAGSVALSTLTKAKKLKRTPLGKGMLGSTYSIA